MNYLVLQVLGNSDVQVDGKIGAERLQEETLEDVQELAEMNDDELINDLSKVDFPLIRQVVEQYRNDADLYLVPILTNQNQWIQEQDIQGSELREIIASDGYWWRNILATWCKKENIKHYPLHLEITSKIPKGAADWEGMAKIVDCQLNQIIESNADSLVFHPPNSSDETVEIDQIILQHSSGTPASSSALYLWGIEQKLAHKPIQFVYISKQDYTYYQHPGNHWQWRLKVPQIRQLLDIQDFSGALALLDNYPDKKLKTELRKLDEAISFNITGGFTAKREVIERISIALWSEKDFRVGGKWMQWYMRIAGAFELAILDLVSFRGGDSYKWEKEWEKTTELQYKSNQFRVSIRRVVKELLNHGRVADDKNLVTYEVQSLPNSKDWQGFLKFYCDDGWRLNSSDSVSFLDLRNDLYHALKGDLIDKRLDKQTEVLKTVTHPQHPSEFAVNQLRYLLELAGTLEEVEERVQSYQSRLENIKESLGQQNSQ